MILILIMITITTTMTITTIYNKHPILEMLLDLKWIKNYIQDEKKPRLVGNHEVLIARHTLVVMLVCYGRKV